uniref:Major facilitator superfamily (MFS) profile domain-containing protein n=1 Tax=Globodera rostochiensis TaxID=31243 RepID=A0A914I0Y4_GLORO
MSRRARSLFCVSRRRMSAASAAVLGSSVGGATRAKREASLVHALVVIFLEFFSWGLLTVPVINVLAETFPANKFLMNGLILGLKGILSFLSSPLIGALSDVCGRKPFLLLTVFFTCVPIPCLKISAWWYFTLFTLSGLFSVTFSVVLAYVADITERHERTTACGLVSATFAASLVTSPALGAYLSSVYSDNAVVLLATGIAALDLLFIALCVPESLKPVAGGEGGGGGAGGAAGHSPDSASGRVSLLKIEGTDPLFVLRFLRDDPTVLRLCAIVFLSYLPEAGQFSCFFVYLRLVVGFSPEAVALFIAYVGVLSVFSQTGFLLLITQRYGPKSPITLGLLFQFIQLVWYGLGSAHWMMWGAGLFAALSQTSYPAISAFVSLQTDKELQGTVQGILSGIRGLCQGMGPAFFGLIFYAFNMDLSSDEESAGHIGVGPQFPVPNIRLPPFKQIIAPNKSSAQQERLKPFNDEAMGLVPGPPFLCAALLVFMAILLNWSLVPARKRLLLLRRGAGGGGGTSRHHQTDAATLLIDDNGEKAANE